MNRWSIVECLNSICFMALRQIAALEVAESGARRLHLPRLELLQTTYAGNVVATLQACRLTFITIAFCSLLCNGLQSFLGLELGAMLLDGVARASDSLRRPKSRARVLAVLTDRCVRACVARRQSHQVT